MIDLARAEQWRMAMANALGDVPVEVSHYGDVGRLVIRAYYAVTRTDRHGVAREWPTTASVCIDGYDDPTDYAVEDLVEQFHAKGYPRP